MVQTNYIVLIFLRSESPLQWMFCVVCIHTTCNSFPTSLCWPWVTWWLANLIEHCINTGRSGSWWLGSEQTHHRMHYPCVCCLTVYAGVCLSTTEVEIRATHWAMWLWKDFNLSLFLGCIEFMGCRLFLRRSQYLSVSLFVSLSCGLNRWRRMQCTLRAVCTGSFVQPLSSYFDHLLCWP